MKIILLFCIIVGALRSETISAEVLDGWLLAQVQKDEQLLSDAISQTNGASLELLKYARTYVPFFLEPPTNSNFESVEQKTEFNSWIAKSKGEGFLPGGYIYRLRFADAPPLYATSAGGGAGNLA